MVGQVDGLKATIWTSGSFRPCPVFAYVYVYVYELLVNLNKGECDTVLVGLYLLICLKPLIL